MVDRAQAFNAAPLKPDLITSLSDTFHRCEESIILALNFGTIGTMYAQSPCGEALIALNENAITCDAKH